MDIDPLLEDETVLQCPGCQAWQLHYDPDSMIDLVEWVKGRDGLLHPDYRRIDSLIEFFLSRHLQMECRHPEIVHQLWKQSGRPHQ